jgi:thiol-disulfide isomerase/thioredoxin
MTAWQIALLRTILAGSFLAAVVSSGSAQQALPANSLLHKQAPAFSREGFNKEIVDLHACRGKVVLLNFWATWCAPCQLEMPRLVEWQKQYGPRGLQIVGISMDDDPTAARTLYDKLRLNYPVAMGDEELGKLYGGILGLPVTFLIDADGRVAAEYRGETDLNAMEAQFRLLLPVPSN